MQSVTFVVAVLSVAVAIVLVAGEQPFPDENPECRQNRPETGATECCKMPGREKEMEGIKQCHQDAKAQDAEACPSQCWFGGANVFTDDNEFKPEAVLGYMQVQFADFDAGFGELHEKAIEHCIQHIKDHPRDGPMDQKCDHRPMHLLHCLSRQYVLNCPAGAWTESDSCTAWKSFVEKCPHARMHPRRPRNEE